MIEAQSRALSRLASPGTWFTGAERMMIAKEVRNSKNCSFCKQQKEAISPNAVSGEHNNLTDLSGTIVEIIHRITTDSSRLTESWLGGILAQGVSDAEYIEILGIVTTTISLDTFAYCIGCDPLTFPSPVDGEPSRLRPASATSDMAWIATVDISKATSEERAIYAEGKNNVRRALSLVTAEASGFFDLVDHMYLNGSQIADFKNEVSDRAISRAQIELLSSRVSALNQCYY
jgi:hypothetical protein